VAVDEHRQHGLIVRRALERGRQVGVHRDRQRVLLLRPVDLDAQDAVSDAGEDPIALGGSHRQPPLTPASIAISRLRILPVRPFGSSSAGHSSREYL
jgi:hypothetical protein